VLACAARALYAAKVLLEVGLEKKIMLLVKGVPFPMGKGFRKLTSG
jgi:hypothetical protein